MYIWVNAFQQVWGRVRLNNFFWRGGVRIFSNSSYKFCFLTLINLLSRCRLETCITCDFSLIFLAYFVLLNVFLIVSFISSLFKRKSV